MAGECVLSDEGEEHDAGLVGFAPRRESLLVEAVLELAVHALDVVAPAVHAVEVCIVDRECAEVLGPVELDLTIVVGPGQRLPRCVDFTSLLAGQLVLCVATVGAVPERVTLVADPFDGAVLSVRLGGNNALPARRSRCPKLTRNGREERPHDRVRLGARATGIESIATIEERHGGLRSR